MFKTLRNNSKIIVYIIVIAMVLTGAFMGFGSYMNWFGEEGGVQSPYIARVNNNNIRQEDFWHLVQAQAAQYPQLTDAQLLPFKFEVLNSLIEEELLVQEAAKLRIRPDISQEKIDETIAMILAQYQMTEEELLSNLEMQGLTMKDLHEDIKNNLELNEKVQQTIEHNTADVVVTEEEIKREYEEINLAIVRVDFNEDTELAESKIEQAQADLAYNVDFATVVAEYSDYVTDDGQLGFMKFNDRLLPAQVMEHAFSMEKGEISDIISSEDAYYILNVIDKIEASGEEYEEAKIEIEERLFSDKKNQAINTWFTGVRENADIIIFDHALSGFKALSNHDYEKAVTEFSKAKEYDSSVSIYNYLAEAYQGLGQGDKVSALYEEGVAKHPDNVELRLGLGDFYLQSGQADKALVEYDTAAELIEAGDLMAHYQLYMAYMQLGEEEKAEEQMQLLEEIQQQMYGGMQPEVDFDETELEADELLE